ncbi:MAG: hypothetical protein KGM98_08190 [Bacteroidota bacterium]|nr:hypothetical protein [Bacteroidota bacterium]
MKSKITLEQNLAAMLKKKGHTCLSVVVPTHPLAPQKRVDELEVHKAIDRAKEYLDTKCSEEIRDSLMDSLSELYSAIDFNRQSDGLGLYVSENFKLAVSFPFPVEEKVIVADTFEVRDILYKLNYGNIYFLLMLSENGAHLFEGTWDELEEIKDTIFPIEHELSYEYQKAAKSSSLAGYAHVKSFEKDKTEVEEIRMKDFFRLVDRSLNNYLLGVAPLIILAPKKELSWFERVSGHQNLVIKKLAGNYEHEPINELASIAWHAVQQHVSKDRLHLKEVFAEEIGHHRGVNGIQEVWKAAGEGRGYKLLVEKDFRKAGFVEKDRFHLYLRPPRRSHKILADAVDDIIESVLETNGQVFFTDNGALKEYNRIAMITRY